MYRPMMRIITGARRLLLALLLLVPAALAATPVKADQSTTLLIFYGSLKVAQIQSLQATANYYEAIGMGSRGQEMMRLASDFQSGSLGGADGVKTFAQCSQRMEADILELQAIGAAPTAQQLALAKKAGQQFAIAKVAMVAAIVSGTKLALDSDGNAMQKIMIALLIGAEAAQVLTSINRVSAAATAYRTFELGGSNGFQSVSKEAQPAFASL